MPAIRMHGLTKRYGSDVFAVDDLTLTVEEGEVFGFLGPNGAGKSTTIDVLMDYVRPTSGRATVFGHDVHAEADAVHRRVGILPDGYGLYERLPGRRHVEYAIRLKDAGDDPDEVLRRVGLDPAAAERAAGTYSKGMRQRLALGMALVGDPDLLILDEPSSGLDPDGIRDVRRLARDHADAGGTVFFSSHILDQVEAVCDRVGILSRGRLVAVDTIEGLRDALGTGTTITLVVDRVPAASALDGIEGVAEVAFDDGSVRATCTDPAAKVAVIDAVRDAGATVLDVETSEDSLEDLFAAYTHGDAVPERAAAPEQSAASQTAMEAER